VDFLRDHPHARIFHQADFVLAELTGGLHVSDENNALKTGYDPVLRRWPDWVAAAGLNAASLPAVVPAGTRVSQISRQIAARFGFNRKAVVVAGTTDGCAAFLAAGGRAVGDAVTSIGSTLVLKVAGAEPICDPLSGVYSHRLGEIWLAGGASNSGGAALLKHFTPEEMTRLEPLMRPETPSGLSYYPLPGTGERFPETNPERQSEVMPIPDDRAVFLQGLFEGIASIEAAGYGKLQSLGLPRPSRIASTGKTAANDALRRIRERTLCMSLPPASRADVCVGVARLVSMDHQRRDPGANLA
jgi:sugar (pentulose or hexulose) kinase